MARRGRVTSTPRIRAAWGRFSHPCPTPTTNGIRVFKVNDTYVLSIEVGVEKGQRWRPALAVSKSPRSGWRQLPVDTVLQTGWHGLYRDDAMYHVATPAFYPIDGRWYLYAQACPLPANRNYIDGAWDLWVVESGRRICTLPGFAEVWVPGQPVLGNP